MGRRGRSHRFLDYWHHRELPLADGDVLHWVLIDDPRHGAPHVECPKVIAADGETRLLHATEALELLTDLGHPDAEHVRVETHVGVPFTH